MMHSFDIDVATEYGVNSAVLLQNIFYWCKHNEANEAQYHDGYYWTYNSVRAYQELFPYMSQKAIQTALKNLIDAGLIVTGKYNKSPYDHTTWYAVTPKGETLLEGKEPETGQVTGQVTEQEKPEARAKKPKPKKTKYGEYQHVELTDEDMDSLTEKLGTEMTERCIIFLDEYMEMNKKYRRDNHKLCIFKWVVDAVKERDEKVRRQNPGGALGGYDWEAI